MSKYEPLARYLKNVPDQEHSLTFEQIEAIIGSKLPPSSYKHRALWSNNPQGHVMAQAWLNAGWESSDVDMQGRKLVFKRTRNPPPPSRPGGFSDHPPSPLSPPDAQPSSTTLTLSGIDAATLARLNAKAELTGRSIEDVARDIIARGAILSPDERLALADRVRARSPALHDIDMAAIIRQDRDNR